MSWSKIKDLGIYKIGEKTESRISLDSDGQRFVLNIRNWTQNSKGEEQVTRNGYAIDLENEELLTGLYNALGQMLDKPKAKAKAPKEKELSPEAKKRLARMGIAM